ncbi:MAG: choice-of-anchor D domain-containing protein [Alphaproteobacteria bacterium]|nr:choice-of-anchor D domain-containing protein [Alphaproteobacteria bacterium]
MLFGVLALVSACNGGGGEPQTRLLDYPIIDFSSQWLEFGFVEFGETETRTFIIQNQGDLTMGIKDIYEGRGQDEDFEITWDVANITCPDDEAAKSMRPAPDATIWASETEIDFGEVEPGDSDLEALVVTNVGDTTLTFAGVFVVPSTEGFSIFSGGDVSSVALEPSQSHNIILQYAPTDANGNTATLIINSNDPNNNLLEIPLLGNQGGSSTDDTGGADDTSEPTDDTGGPVSDGQVLFTLGPDCRIPVDVAFTPVHVGEVYGSVIVETATQQREDEEEPEYWSDIDHDRSIIYLQGDSELTEGRVIVQPRSMDFGHIWTGEEEVQYIQVSNAGNGELILTQPTLDENCSEGYNISWSYAPDATDEKILEGDSKTLIEVSFVPVDQNDAYCTLYVNSDDADNPQVPVYLQGNSGVDPDNTPPTVAIRSPDPGYVHNTSGPIEMELNVFDRDQPAESLTCRIKSALLVGATVAYCTPTDASGHVFVDVPLDAFDPGVDTIQVLVTDVAGTTSVASIPVVINSVFPASDDDGDGFGSEDSGMMVDCNDNSIVSYPEAAEIYDGLDNDCDLLIDEGTEGADDDGDTLTEIDGDCDDNDAFTLPGIAEAADHKDNDCDGDIDEGTNLFDDDGDGYAEVNNDCLDNNPDIHPGAVEVCDDIDNDCNGRIDDACLQIDSTPIIVGGINMSQTACESAEVIQLSVFVYDADGQTPTYTWNVEEDASIDNSNSPTVNFTCPTLDGNDGKLSQVYSVVADPDGHQVWDFAEVAVYPTDTLYQQYIDIVFVNPNEE